MDYGKALKYIILNSVIEETDVKKFNNMVKNLNNTQRLFPYYYMILGSLFIPCLI